MGQIFTEISLSNPKLAEVKPLQVRALADTGALMLCIPEHIALQLKLETESTREVTVADGHSLKVPYAGPMEDMDLVLNPARQQITVDPRNPNLAHSRVKPS